MSVRVHVTKNRLPGLELRLSDRVRGVTRFTAERVVEEAKSRAPVRTGTLRDSIRVRRVNQYRNDVVVGAPYGQFVEFGTSRMAAQPFFIPAAESVRDEFIKLAREALRTVVR